MVLSRVQATKSDPPPASIPTSEPDAAWPELEEPPGDEEKARSSESSKPVKPTPQVDDSMEDSRKKAETERKATLEAAERAAAEEVALEDAKFRTWTSKSGKFTTEAKIIAYANGVVTLERRDGKRVKVPQDKLTHSDRDFIKQWRHDRH